MNVAVGLVDKATLLRRDQEYRCDSVFRSLFREDTVQICLLHFDLCFFAPTGVFVYAYTR